MVAAEALDTTLRIESFRLTPVFGRVVVLLQRVLSWTRSRVACVCFACALSRSLDRLLSFILPSFPGFLSSFLFLPFRSFLSCVLFLLLFPLLPFLSFRSFLSFLSFLFFFSFVLSFPSFDFFPLFPFASPFRLSLLSFPAFPSHSLPSFGLPFRSEKERQGEKTERCGRKEGRKKDRKEVTRRKRRSPFVRIIIVSECPSSTPRQ